MYGENGTYNTFPSTINTALGPALEHVLASRTTCDSAMHPRWAAQQRLFVFHLSNSLRMQTKMVDVMNE